MSSTLVMPARPPAAIKAADAAQQRAVDRLGLVVEGRRDGRIGVDGRVGCIPVMTADTAM